MQILEWIRFGAGVGLLLIGLSIFLLELIGVFKFSYVLNRMHAAAMGDTLGIALILIGLIIVRGFGFDSLKFVMIIALLWLASPVSSHLITLLETTIDPESSEYRREKH